MTPGKRQHPDHNVNIFTSYYRWAFAVRDMGLDVNPNPHGPGYTAENNAEEVVGDFEGNDDDSRGALAMDGVGETYNTWRESQIGLI